jgi:hypothetical protein
MRDANVSRALSQHLIDLTAFGTNINKPTTENMKRLTTRAALLSACIAWLTTSTGQAVLITYSDRAAFNADNPVTAIEDFQDVSSISQVLSGINITPGVSFALTSGSDAYLAGPGQSSNPTTAIGVNVPASAGWVISFSTAVNAVALDVFQNFGGGSQSGSAILALVEVYGSSGLLGSFNANVPSGSAGFVGVYSGLDEITSVVVNNSSSFDVIDDVAFGNTGASVPDAGSPVILLGLALGGLGALRRKYGVA